MSSHQEPYPDSDQGQRDCAGGAGPSAPHPSSWSARPAPLRQSWPSTLTTIDQSGHEQLSQFNDPVGSLLQGHDAEDMFSHYPHSDAVYAAPSTSSNIPPVYAENGFTLDNVPFDPFANLSLHGHSDPVYGQAPEHQMIYGPYWPTYINPQQTNLQQLGNGPQAADPSPVQARPMLAVDTSARSSPGGLSLRSASTGTISLFNAEAGQHSHPSPVTTDLTQAFPVPGTSRAVPSSPEKRRLLEEDSDFIWLTLEVGGAENVPGRGPRIPQDSYAVGGTLAFNASDERKDPITFNLENPSEVGIPLIDILRGTENFRRLQDRTQTFSFADAGRKTFTLRVLWPGYHPWHKTVATMDWRKARAPITRSKLAEGVAIAIRDMIGKHRNKPYDRDYAAWNVGPSGIQLSDIVLVCLRHVSKGSWQPELCLLQARR
ncbi:hypothetical protein BU15DRAFT_64324 [Melanogaster broomeanus]|nr:hypothetical protein BU15DRAFT_64324 [Melanogaster broomeanus]